MKKSLFIGLVAVLGLIGCSRNQEIDVPDANLSIFARTESPAESRTVVESGTHVYWEPGDEIAVFMGEKAAKFTTDITAASGTATFKGTFGDQGWSEELDLWAVYPFSEDAVFDGETISTTLPSTQVAREGSFGKDMNLAIAHSNTSTLQFYNVDGGLRFSVLEEGIKKVMFEGLSGEIISGKVKIGMDENGKPEVREVTGGSQFITLLPPSGQETFQPGTWYYIVAIPGSLEGGYKLRFYKNSDYARKVSEKAVEIKRSIFGSLEKADSGIDYEPQTTHFPQTEKECEKSVELTEAIQVEVNSILWGKSDSEIIDIDAKVEEISKIEGVISVEKNEDETCLSVVQRDSLCVNYMLYDPTSGLNETSRSEVVSAFHSLSVSRSSADKANANNKAGKTALVLAPFQKDFDKSIIDTWIPELSVNYSSESIKYLPNSEADLYQFKEQLSKQYDFILIDTHGITGKCARTSINPFDIKNAFLCTATPYNLDISWEILTSEAVRNNEVAVVAIPDGRKYVGVNPKILENASYNDSCVIITACESAMTLDKKVPWLDTFLSKGALVVSGAKVSMQIGLLGVVANQLIQVMTIGCSFKDAFTYVTKSSRMISLCNEIHTVFGGEFSEVNVRDNYIYKQNEHKPVQDYYLTNPKSHLNTPIVNGELTILSWSTSSISFPKTIYLEDTVVNKKLHKSPISFNQTFDVYVDGEKVSTSCFESGDNTGQTVTIPTPSSGPHSWKVITNIIEIDTGITLGSYASEEDYFTIVEEIKYETPEAKDLGLSVKWGSFNLGATKPEDYGIYYAWGETEPYYYSLDPLIWKNGKEAGYTWASYGFAKGAMNSLTKYCGNSEFGFNGFTDGKTELDLVDDAANVTLGEKWRIPTREEILELINKCSWEWTTMDGVEGRKVTGPNGNSIFLPAAGDWDGTSHLNDANSNNPNGALGFYASASLSTGNPNQSYFLSFGSGGKACYANARSLGYTIRPVYGDKKTAMTGDIEATEEDPWN